MCREFSCIVARTGRVYPQVDDPSHTAIAALYNLPEDGKSELHRAKVEVVLNDPDAFLSIPSRENGWTLIVDEQTKPRWWNERHERNAWNAAVRWWRSRILSDGSFDIRSGTWLVLKGSPTIKQSGGWVYTCESSTPTITQSGGEVYTYGSSTPTITQGGGVVSTYGSSTPTITQGGGVVSTYGSSTPTITQSGGEVYTYGSSTPTITQSGGWVYTYESSTPTITQSGGVVYTYGSSTPTITRVEKRY